MKYFRVKYGYGKDEFYSVDENEVGKAIRAQLSPDGVAIFNEGTVRGSSIIIIKPDYNRLMGYNRQYELVDEDYQEIGQKRIKEHELFYENTKLALEGKTTQERPKEISDGVKQLADKMSVGNYKRL